MASTFNFLFLLFTLVFCSSRILAELTPENKKLAIDLHNEYRRQVYPEAANMLKMTWDDELANEAQKWADNCNLANNPHASSPSYGRVGQNIYASPDLENIVSNAIAIWDDERLIYHENGSCDITNACGHYTQLVWAKSYKLGMAVSSRKCSSDDFPSGMYLAIAYYAQAGNYAGEFPYTRGPSGSSCFAGSAKGPDSMCWVTDENKLKETIGR